MRRKTTEKKNHTKIERSISSSKKSSSTFRQTSEFLFRLHRADKVSIDLVLLNSFITQLSSFIDDVFSFFTWSHTFFFATTLAVTAFGRAFFLELRLPVVFVPAAGVDMASWCRLWGSTDSIESILRSSIEFLAKRAFFAAAAAAANEARVSLGHFFSSDPCRFGLFPLPEYAHQIKDPFTFSYILKSHINSLFLTVLFVA